jgi:hypothetical protein
MWMLVLMTLVNAVLHQHGVQNKYRIELGIIQLGIVEFTMGLTFLYALLRGGAVRAQSPTLRTHPVLVWVLLPFAVGGFFGVAGGLLNGNEMKFVLTSGREWFAFPVCIIAGYRLLARPVNAWRMSQVMIVGGVLTATGLFLAFGEKTETTTLTGSLGQMRGIITYYNADYASVAALLLVFVVLTRFPLWRTSICVLVGLYCYIGYAATLSRIGFLILFFGTASSYALLTKGERLRKFLRSIVFLPILFFACWGALWVGDQVIGRDFAGKVMKHIESLLPGDRTGQNEKAWDSRLDGIAAELGIWIKNPLMGQGFGAGETAYLTGRTSGMASIKHNSWTATLAEMGVFGFTGLAVMVGSMILMGYRMVHDRTDRTFVLMGALGFFAGVVFLMRCSATMGMTSRAAMGFGLVCGMLIRTREMQETAMAFAGAPAYDQAHVDAQTGLLVPEYGYEMGPFGATSN